MDQIEEYRERAIKKYRTEQLKKEQQEKELEEKQKEEECRRLDEENMKTNKALSIILEIEDHIDCIQFNSSQENITYTLSMVDSIIQTHIEYIIETNKITELQNAVMNLVNILNKLNENKNIKDLLFLKIVSDKIKSIFDLVKIDIKIEVMDTNNDEDFAKKFEEQIKLLDIESDEKFAKELNEEFMNMSISKYKKTHK